MSLNRPTVAHLIYRFDIGGLERVMVNCINAMENENVNHVVIALTEVSEFAYPFKMNIKTYQLDKRPGLDFSVHFKLFRLLREIKPDILHTYNLATLEYHPIALLSGVTGRIHAEHGRDAADPQGKNKKHNMLRRLISPFVDCFVPVSLDLKDWLIDQVRLPKRKVKLIRNGIDTEAFNSSKNAQNDFINFIHVARLDKVKDQANLLTAFSLMVQDTRLSAEQVKLTIVGDGTENQNLKEMALKLGIDTYVNFAGTQTNIPDWLSQADVFVLSSIAEGIPMTVLEAMAAGLPVISTDVGGLAELVENNKTGLLVEKQNSEALSNAMVFYVQHPDEVVKQGENALQFVTDQFSEINMVNKYLSLYQKSLGIIDVRN